MRLKIHTALFFLSFFLTSSAQILLQQPISNTPPPAGNEKYLKTISDTTGVVFYEPLNSALGGDSVRYDRRKYAARGWMEDFYPDGKTLHKGYYVEGQLKSYKNFYPNGKMERDFKTMDNYKCILLTYYPTGTLKSSVEYKNGLPLVWEDYYPDGKLEYREEFDKNIEHYLLKKSFFPSGKAESVFEMRDPKKLIYISQEYYETGLLKEEGKAVFNKAIFDYQNIGKWQSFDESGKLKKESYYVDGKINKEQEY